MWLSPWKVLSLRRESANSSHSHLYENAYKAWHQVWEDVLKSVAGAEKLHADAFTRQDECLTLFYRDQVAALSLFRWVDLSNEFHRNDSYFQYWPEQAVQKLTRNGQKVLVSSFFTVIPEFRRNAELPVKDVLMGLNVRRLISSGCNAMTGNMRNSKGVNNLCYEWGATPLLRDILVYGEKSDLVGFFPEICKQASRPELLSTMDELWSTHEVLDDSKTELKMVA